MSKVKMGMKVPKFAKITAEGAAALPTYDSTKIITVGEAVSGALTINRANAELYSDDGLNVKADEFSSASLALETDGIEDDVAAAIYGAAVASGLVTYSAGDVAPHGGLVYYTPMKDRSGSVYYKCYFFPKVQAAMGSDNAQTKASSVTFQTANTTFTIFACNTGAWMQTEIVESEAEAVTWCETKLGKTA